MKGRLYKTEQGWQVIYKGEDPRFLGLQILPLHPDDTIGIGQEENEIEFEIIEFPVPPTNGPVSNSISKYAKLVDYSWIKMKEGDITVNFKPMPEFDDPKYPDYSTRAQQIHIQIAEECFRKYPNNKELYTTDELKDAYKAGVIDGLKEWTLDIYDRPKYPEVKIICPRCKDIMPCECNSSWDDVWKAFYMAEKQVPEGARRLIIDVWLTENYNPPTKKQD
jgi:hypothetical protein